MGKALAIDPDIGLRDVLEISQSNEYDLVYNPTLQGPGNIVGGTFIKRSVAWAGDSTTFDEPDALAGDATVRGLKEHKKKLESAHGSGQQGMCLLNKDGQVVPVPYRAGLSAEVSDNNTYHIVDGTEGVSLNEALNRYVSITGNSLHLPSAY